MLVPTARSLVQARSAVVLIAAFVALTGLTACQPSGSDRPHKTLDSGLDALRTAFNADSGTVRVVMLAAPT